MNVFNVTFDTFFDRNGWGMLKMIVLIRYGSMVFSISLHGTDHGTHHHM